MLSSVCTECTCLLQLAITSKGLHAATVRLEHVQFKNDPVALLPPPGSYGSPLYVGGNSDSCFMTGGIIFTNCSVTDSFDRPFFTMDNSAGECPKTKSGEYGLANITAAFSVTNPFGCKLGKTANGTDIDISVACTNASSLLLTSQKELNVNPGVGVRGRLVALKSDDALVVPTRQTTRRKTDDTRDNLRRVVAQQIELTVSPAAAGTSPFARRGYQRSFGSGHASLGLRADWQAALGRAASSTTASSTTASTTTICGWSQRVAAMARCNTILRRSSRFGTGWSPKE